MIDKRTRFEALKWTYISATAKSAAGRKRQFRIPTRQKHLGMFVQEQNNPRQHEAFAWSTLSALRLALVRIRGSEFFGA